ncbi:trigger factor [Aestuariivirga litoralis]|uniref:trigger factor n=1 Tax=Aestuariivirga litoralis TaxID=2650924 RepID=UPI0018C7CF3F|nr:trigger factor [Aestuariivirga litoralis]MBG1231440.1 trigger factor [Aestuariivirga litoralis]
MQVTETVNSGLKREFKVVVGAADLNKDLDAKLKDIAGKAQIKGFRPGKVPVAHVKNLYGKSAMAEVIQEKVDAQSRQVFADRNLKPAYQPEVKLPEDETEVNAVMDGKADLTFTVATEVVPEFEVKDFAGIELAKHIVTPSDEHVDESLKQLTEQYKSFGEKKDGPAAKGDRVTIDFVGSIDGTEFDGGKGDDIPLEIGSNQFIPGFEDQLVGAKEGDDRTVKVTFPADYGAAHLAGKEASFAVKVKSVEIPGEAKVDDEFAKKVGFEDLAKLKEMVKSGLDREFAQMTAMKLKRDVLDAMDKQYAFELPQRLVDAEFEGIWSALQQEMTKANKTFADENTTEDQARTDYRKIAERRVRLGLVLGTIGEKEGVTITDQELQQALIARARQFPGQEKQVFDFYRQNNNALLELRGPIFEQKVVDHIVAKAKVSDKQVSREELKALVEDEETQDAA